jgi:hypothetical protein
MAKRGSSASSQEGNKKLIMMGVAAAIMVLVVGWWLWQWSSSGPATLSGAPKFAADLGRSLRTDKPETRWAGVSLIPRPEGTTFDTMKSLLIQGSVKPGDDAALKTKVTELQPPASLPIEYKLTVIEAARK